MASTGASGFQAQVVEEGGRPVVLVRGEIDLATAEALQRSVEEALARDTRLVIDLADAPFIDSTGLGILLRAYHANGQIREGIVVRSVSTSVRRALEISGVSELITVVP